jgi:hypothetical protein
LVGFGVLTSAAALPFTVEDQGALAVPQLFQEVCRTAAEPPSPIWMSWVRSMVSSFMILTFSGTFLGAHGIHCRFDSC